jgi:hypothetical protein
MINEPEGLEGERERERERFRGARHCPLAQLFKQNKKSVAKYRKTG